MANLFKESMQRIEIKLTSGTRIRLVPSLGQRDTMVLAYSSDEIDIAFYVPANTGNYDVLSHHISLGRYSQALQHAADIGAIRA